MSTFHTPQQPYHEQPYHAQYGLENEQQHMPGYYDPNDDMGLYPSSHYDAEGENTHQYPADHDALGAAGADHQMTAEPENGEAEEGYEDAQDWGWHDPETEDSAITEPHVNVTTVPEDAEPQEHDGTDWSHEASGSHEPSASQRPPNVSEAPVDDHALHDTSQHTSIPYQEPPTQAAISNYPTRWAAGNHSYSAQASAGGPADKFRHGKAMATFKPINAAITNMVTQSYHVSGKPKATMAFQKTELEVKKIQTLRMQLETQCVAADKDFQTQMKSSRPEISYSSRFGSTAVEDGGTVQDVSAVMKTIAAFGQPLRNMNTLMRQVIQEMGYVDRYILFQKQNPVAAKLLEQVIFSGIKLLIPLPHAPWA